jgi:hypothetical protein
MAAPVVKNFTQAVLSDTGTVSSPSDTSIGDLVVCFVWSQFTTTATTHTIQSGFTEIRTHSHNDGTTCGRLSVACKAATLAGAQNYQAYAIANATAGQTCAGILTITGADTTSPASWIQGSITNTGNQAPDPPALAALSGDALVLAIGAWQITTAGATTTTQGVNYTEQIDGPAGTHLTHLAVASRQLTSLSNTTEDPAIFTDNVTPNGTVAMTIALPYVPPPNFVNTRGRRSSIIGLDGIYRMVLPAPNTAVTGWDRCVLAGKYIGYTADGVVAAAIFRNRTRNRLRLTPSFPC